MNRKAVSLAATIIILAAAGGIAFWEHQKNSSGNQPSSAITITQQGSFLATDQQKTEAKQRISFSDIQRSASDASLTGTITNMDTVQRVVTLQGTYYDQNHNSVSVGYSSIIIVDAGKSAPFQIFPMENSQNAGGASSFDAQVDSIN